jgi:hypothetical protein
MILLQLVKGEFKRLVRYKILVAGIIVSLMWVGITAIISAAQVNALLPMFIFTDTGIMSVLLLAAMMYYEKQEGTLRTTFITPVNVWQVLTAKVFASVIMGLISALMISFFAIIIHGSVINVFLLLLYTVLIVTANCSVGFLFIFYCRDFNSLMVNYMLFLLVFFIPPLLITLGVIPARFENIMLISPLYVSQTLISSTFYAIDAFKIIISIIYLVALSAILIVEFISKKFKNFSIGG